MVTLETNSTASITKIPTNVAINPFLRFVLQASVSCSNCKKRFIINNAL